MLTELRETQWECQQRSREYKKELIRAEECAMLSGVQLFSTPWTAAGQAPLSMGLLQARILEWVAIPSSRRSSQPSDWTQVSCIAGRFFTIWATREAQKYSRENWY